MIFNEAGTLFHHTQDIDITKRLTGRFLRGTNVWILAQLSLNEFVHVVDGGCSTLFCLTHWKCFFDSADDGSWLIFHHSSYVFSNALRPLWSSFRLSQVTNLLPGNFGVISVIGGKLCPSQVV